MGINKLNGKRITYVDGGFEAVGEVIIEPGVGFTIVDANDKDNYLTCARGPLAMPKMFEIDPEAHEIFEIVWEKGVEMIRSGRYDATEMDRALIGAGLSKSGNSPGANTCAFSM